MLYGAPPQRQFMHRVSHLVLSGVALWLGYIFTDGTPSFSYPSYVEMEKIMSEQDWGYLCIVCGLYGLLTTFAIDWRVRISSAVVLGFMHGWIAFEIWKAASNVTLPGLYVGYAILAFALAYSTGHLSQRGS